MNIKEVRKAVGSIRSALFKNSNSYSIGMLKSHFRGSGLQFKDHQIYNHGDDVRFIDWKMLAKVTEPYIKIFEEERNVEIVVCLDTSRSMFYGYDNITKMQACLELICLLHILAKETNDYVHVLVISDKITSIQKSNGEKGIALLLQHLNSIGIISNDGHVNLSYSSKINVNDNDKYTSIMKHLKKKHELVILSDFHEFLNLQALKKVIANKHTHAFRVISPLDVADKIPYSLLIRSENKNLFSTAKMSNTDFNIDKNNKIKTLNVKDRYLEEFIKEML